MEIVVDASNKITRCFYVFLGPTFRDTQHSFLAVSEFLPYLSQCSEVPNCCLPQFDQGLCDLMIFSPISRKPELELPACTARGTQDGQVEGASVLSMGIGNELGSY